MNIYPFIEAERVGQHDTVKRSCELLKVSKAAYYEWRKHTPSRRHMSDEELKGDIERVYNKSRHRYGAPRVTQQLRAEGICVGKKRVARLMVDLGLIGRCKRRWKRTTIADPNATAVADLIEREFGPGVVELDRRYVGDITYIWTWEGWAYLATVLDLTSRRVVGWALCDHMEATLVCDALEMALVHRRPPPGFIFHADQGSQYTSKAFRKLLKGNGGIQSLGRKGQCWDNAVAESFFGTLKEELIHTQSWSTRQQLRRAIFEYIEVFYNRQRLHSSLGYLTPARYEEQLTRAGTATQAA